MYIKLNHAIMPTIGKEGNRIFCMVNVDKETKQEKMLWATVSLGNMQRCFYSALLFASSTPFLLFLLFFGMQKEEMQPFIIPVAFFVVFSIASACFLFHVMKQKAKQYYNAVSGAYVVLLMIYLIFFARLSYQQEGSLLLYYAAVLVGAYVIHTPFVQYAVLCALELLGLLFVISGAGKEMSGIGLKTLAAVIAVYLFAFLLSRECYQARCKAVYAMQKPKAENAKAGQDFLTGLLNRRGLEYAMQSVWTECVRQEALVAAMLINIDDFTRYNETFGHVEGDLCIRLVARSIAGTAGKSAVTARINGGDFFVFARGRSKRELLELAERIRLNIEELRLPQATQGLTVTVSIGVGIEKAEADSSLRGLYKRADDMLFQAKREGRNHIESNCFRGEKYHKIG